MKRRSIFAALLAVLALSWAAPAFAVTYGTNAHPIKAEDNSGSGNAWFYGQITIDQQVQLRNAYNYKDSAPGGNPAYAKTTWYFWRDCTDGDPCFDWDQEDRSSNTTSSTWRTEADYAEFDLNSDRGRGVARVCEQQSWNPDDCSKAVTITLSY